MKATVSEAANETGVPDPDASSREVHFRVFEAEVAKKLTADRPLPLILQDCAQSVVNHLGAAFARIWTLNQAAQVLELQASAGQYTHLDGPHSRVPLGQFKIGLIAAEKQPHLTNSVIGDPRVNNQEWARREGMIAFAGYPLMAGDDVVGVLAMFARHTLDEAALETLAAISQSVASLIRRRQAEEQLAATTAQLSSVLDSATQVSIISTDTRGVIQVFNAGAERMLGYAAAEVIGRLTPQIIHLESEVVAYGQKLSRELGREIAGFEVFVEAARRGGFDEREWTYVRKNGTHLTVNLVVTAIRDQQGNLIGFLGIATDVTKRKQAEEQLRTVVEAAPNGMVMIGRDGRIRLVNRAAELMFGYDRSELVGQPVEMLVPERVRKQHPTLRHAFFESPAARSMGTGRDLFGVRKDGTEFPVEIGLSPVETVEGPAVLSAVVDISERKRGIDALRTSEERFRELTENIRGVFWLFDARSHEVLYVSPAYEAIWGRSREEVLRNPTAWSEAIHPDDRYRVETLFIAATATGVFDTEYCLVRPDGSKRWIHDRGYPIRDANHEIARIAGIAEDITERKRIEQALRTTNEDLEAFCYSVSHDLRAPLRHIDGFSQAVMEDYADSLQEDGKEMLGTIRESAHKMGALIDNLLVLSRVSRREMQIEEIELAGLVAGVLSELTASYADRDLHFHVRLEGVVPGDRRMLRLALFNLLDNAIKFTAGRKPAIIEVASKRSETGPIYFVRDNGVGFNMKFSDKLFVPFQRLHRVEEFPGTGIGLSITRRVIGRHGGRIWAEAEVDRGATFYFTIGRELRLTSDEFLPDFASVLDEE